MRLTRAGYAPKSAFASRAGGLPRSSRRRPNYYVHILAEVAASDEMAVLAAAHGRLQPGVLTYRAAVEFTPPDVGRYQLLGTVVISDYNAVGVTVGPKLKVIP